MVPETFTGAQWFNDEVECLPDTGGGHHVEGACVKRINAAHGAAVVEFAAEIVDGLQEPFAVANPFGDRLFHMDVLYGKVVGAWVGQDSERVCLRAEVGGAKTKGVDAY